METMQETRSQEVLEHKRQVFELLMEAVELSEVERQALLGAADPELAGTVQRLLEGDETTDDFLRSGALEADRQTLLQDEPSPLEADQVIGPYRILRPLGAGGMGHVYLAEQEEPVRRQVALKVLRLSLALPETRRRFDDERRAMERLDHPNIGKILDAGTTHEMPYLVMERINGEPITNYCDRLRFGVEDRLRLVIDVCRAVEHAHQRFLLHRDIKPSNVLVTEIDRRPVPKLIDFGIAKVLDPAGAPELTGPLLLGTPSYMSPEALLREQDLDTRSDVYSLGMLLYELLCGVSALPAGLNLPSRLQRLGDGNLPSPAARFQQLQNYQAEEIALRRQCTVKRLRAILKGEPGWIVARATQPDRDTRYRSAAELAEDLRRYLNAEPVLASRPIPFYQLRKLVQRHRTAATAITLAALTVLAALAITSVSLIQANRARAESDAVSKYLMTVFKSVDPWSADFQKFTAESFLDYGYERLAIDLADYPESRVGLLSKIADSNFHRGRGDLAAQQYEHIIEQASEMYGPRSSEMASFFPDLAQIYSRAGRMNEAVALLERNIEIFEENGTSPHRAHTNLGDILLRNGRFAQAEPHLRRSIAIRRAKIPPKPASQWLQELNGLAESLARQGRHEEAAEVAGEAYEIIEGMEAQGYPYARHLQGHARSIELMGRLTAARDLYATVLKHLVKSLEPTDYRIGATHVDLARTERRLGRLDTAEMHLNEALALAESSPPYLFTMTYTELAALAFDRGDQPRAAQYLESARSMIGPETEPQAIWRLDEVTERVHGSSS